MQTLRPEQTTKYGFREEAEINAKLGVISAMGEGALPAVQQGGLELSVEAMKGTTQLTCSQHVNTLQPRLCYR